MVIVPLVLGTWLRWHHGEPAAYALALAPFWLMGYFAFHATSVWLKSRRKPRDRPPMVAYASIAAVLGVITWLLGGVALAWWVVAFAPILLVALVLAAQRHERALVGGLLTVAAACLMVLVARFATPAGILAHLDEPQVITALVLAAACYGYFSGTVFYVKSMIRERGHAGFLALSVGWHLLVLALATWAALAGIASWAWTVFFAVMAARALVLPLVGPMRAHGRRFTPKQVGIAEAVFSVALVVIALTTTP